MKLKVWLGLIALTSSLYFTILAQNTNLLNEARIATWAYPTNVSYKEADEKIKGFSEIGINVLLTEDNRYIIYDLKNPDNEPKFHFKCTNKEASVKATKMVADICHKYNIKILHHVTCCYCTEDFMKAHKDWTQRDLRKPDAPAFFEEYGGVWLLCMNNPEFRKEFFARVVEITKKTGVDGWMIDEVEWLPDWHSCGCKYCLEKFKKETGYDMESGKDSSLYGNFDNKIWRSWLGFRMKSGGEFFIDLKKALDKECPGQILTSCHAGAGDTWLAQWWGMDIFEFKKSLNFIFYEAYVYKGMPFYSWRRYLAELKLYSAVARGEDNPPFTLFYPGLPEESEFCWMLCNLGGHRFWNLLTDDIPHNKFFKWQKMHEYLFDTKETLCNIAILFSKNTRDLYGGRDTKYYVDEWAGWCETLIEANIPFMVISEEDIKSEYLKKFDMLILPNPVCISNENIACIDSFAAQGGKLIISGDAGARDETGEVRTDKKSVNALLKKSKYFQDKIGESYFLGYLKRDKFNHDERRQSAKKKMINSVAGLFQDKIPYSVESHSQVAVTAFKNIKRGSIVFHILNCSGAVLGKDEIIKEKKYPISYPIVEEIKIRIPLNGKIKYTKAQLYSIDKDVPSEIGIENKTDSQVIRLKNLNQYAIIELLM